MEVNSAPCWLEYYLGLPLTGNMNLLSDLILTNWVTVCSKWHGCVCNLVLALVSEFWIYLIHSMVTATSSMWCLVSQKSVNQLMCQVMSCLWSCRMIKCYQKQCKTDMVSDMWLCWLATLVVSLITFEVIWVIFFAKILFRSGVRGNICQNI